MDCPDCGTEAALEAMITITRMVPLAKRNGAVKVGGVKIGQADLKEQWEAGDVREPILCSACGASFKYVVGEKKPLVKVG